jgi:ferredoxin
VTSSWSFFATHPSENYDEDNQLPQGVVVKIIVDFDLCASNAVCMGIAPEIFEVRDDGYLYILNENPGPEFAERMREAVNSCPTGAISIEE